MLSDNYDIRFRGGTGVLNGTVTTGTNLVTTNGSGISGNWTGITYTGGTTSNYMSAADIRVS